MGRFDNWGDKTDAERVAAMTEAFPNVTKDGAAFINYLLKSLSHSDWDSEGRLIRAPGESR